MTLITPNLATDRPADSADWQPISQARLLILVGVTGVGKSTTAEALDQTDYTFDLLPNRRTLTDQLIIATLQKQDQQPVEIVRDRALRFDFTRRYREQFPGGMAHALAQLWVKTKEEATDKEWLLFDGLRGENEVSHAAELLPQARFLVLDAPHFVRVQRLLGRGDQFDKISTSESQSEGSEILGDTADLFTAAQKAQLIGLVTSGQLSQEDLRSKVAIVLKERQNYDPAAAIKALQAIAPTRTFVADTVALSPTGVAEETRHQLFEPN